MKKSAVTMLVVSLIFVLITSVLLFFSTLFVMGTLNALYKPDHTAGDVIGGIFLYLYLVLLCFGTVVAAVLILPFNLIMMIKMKIRKWYTITILVFAIVAIVASVLMFISVPVAQSIADAGKASSSSDPSSAVAALLL